MDLDGLRTSVRTRLGVPSADTFYTDTVLTDLVNEAVQAISLADDWPWQQGTATLTTVAGTQTYTPPISGGDVWLHTRALTPLDEDNSLVLRSLIEVRELGTVQADPSIYTISEELIYLGPTPNSVRSYHHDYIKTEPLLVADVDTPLIPAPFHYAIIHLATAMGHLRQNEGPRFQAEQTQFDQWLQRMHDNSRRSTQHSRIRVRPGSMI